MKIHNKFLCFLWLAVGKPSFSSNAVEIRPGCRNLQWFLIMVNLPETFFGGMQ